MPNFLDDFELDLNMGIRICFKYLKHLNMSCLNPSLPLICWNLQYMQLNLMCSLITVHFAYKPNIFCKDNKYLFLFFLHFIMLETLNFNIF